MCVLITLENLTKYYRSGASCDIRPLDGINLRIIAGERIILLGKSGSGKTTFLNLVGGMDQPSHGRILFNELDITNLSPGELAQYRRKEVGFIFQSFNLFPTLTIGENIMLPLELLGISDQSRARLMLDAVGLDGHWNKFPEQLSGGEQQRVAIARALVKSPSLILADEPTGNLDQETGETILRLIYTTCNERKATLIMATHSVEALWIADRKFKLRSGLLQAEL